MAAQARTRSSARTFFDSNVLIYGDDDAYRTKQGRAIDLIEAHHRSRTGVVSIQVLQEYFVNATRKLGLDPSLAKSKIEVFAKFQVVVPDVTDVLAAIDLHRLSGVSYWDALILRCAKQAGCSVLLTEDMQHGQVVDGVRIVNPFL
jgi:predicted nucleic acid-binding protein